ncbi:hypothetical protein D8674_026775 [Pyrus ussuriensis x Pyrus communis]|uniref:Phospholipase-like protein n=1 Tax=Pyrus ussuriensis x Pyrus communis TaxID=2448454 RepID=A0A5N5ICB7_9ROSA|nr:hypothetical protein D8674_026775 [Pyrus ussuriensis x Pyrus communis]
MSLIGKIHPECVDVVNPYHECTEICLRKIAEGKGRKVTKKKSDIGSSFKYGEHKKRGAEEKRASNPYHDPEFFRQRAVGAEPRGGKKESGSIVDIPILGKQREGSRPKTPQELVQSVIYHLDAQSSPSKENVRLENGCVLDDPILGGRKQGSQPKPSEELKNATGRGVIYPSDSRSEEIVQVENGSVFDDPIFGRQRPGSRPKRPEELDNVSGEIKEEVKIGNGEHKSYSPPSAEVKDASFNKDQVPSSLLVPPSGIITMPQNPKHPRENGTTYVASEPPSNGEDKENINHSPGVDSNHTVSNVGEGSTGSAFDSRFSFSGTVHAFEDSDDDDTRSVISDASVSVGKYRVKGSFSSILQSIMEKYGDIAASCQLESVAMRSYYLECVCYIVQELKRTPIKELTKPKVKQMLSMVKDVESSGMDVGWLRFLINECAESIELLAQHQAFEVAKANCDRDLESTRKELEPQIEALVLKEKEVVNAKKQVAEMKALLRELELKSSVLSDSVSNMKSKVENLPSKPLLDKVL